LEALNREDKVPVTHFIEVNSGETQSHSARKENKSKESRTAYIEDYVSSDTDDIDSDDSTDQLSENEETDTEDEAYAFPVERVTRNSTQGRQERFKEVFPPGQSKNLRKSNEKDKGKDKVPTTPAKKAETQAKPKSTQPTPVTKTKPVNKRDVGPSQEKSWDSDDIVMDDVDDRKATEKRIKYNDSPFKPTLNPDRKTTTTRQRVSDIAAKIKPEKILETVLRTPIRLEVGELLGTSRELSGILANAIKPKTLPNDSKIEAHSVWTKTRGLLIKIAMRCDGQTINAIIDTGSQLNIVNKHIWKTIINRPIDIAKSISMNDANGGEGKLRGLVQNVPLDCGGVSTHANLFVGDHVPFSLLLGRPWQRGNYVSIDERKDGTWLLFKDPLDLEVRYELLCTPDGSDPNWDLNRLHGLLIWGKQPCVARLMRN
jgi:hypothetical protein